jgi:hypothetical protein
MVFCEGTPDKRNVILFHQAALHGVLLRVVRTTRMRVSRNLCENWRLKRVPTDTAKGRPIFSSEDTARIRR